MPVVPTGSPAWIRSGDFTVYGGNLNKQNYLLRGVVDPNTDVSAEQFARMTADLAAIARVAPFCVMVLQLNDTSPAAPTVQRVNMMTGVRNTSYAGGSAPTGFPSAARVSNGVCTVTFSSSYSDEYSVAGAFALQAPQVQLLSGSSGFCSVVRDSDTQVTIRAWSDAGAAISDPLVMLTVWSGP